MICNGVQIGKPGIDSAVWVSSCERLSMTTDQISVSEFMVAIGSAPSMIFPCAGALVSALSV